MFGSTGALENYKVYRYKICAGKGRVMKAAQIKKYGGSEVVEIIVKNLTFLTYYS